MKSINYLNSNKGKHHCKNLVIRCMDWRFSGREISELLKKYFEEENCTFDDPGSVGGSKAIIEEDSRKVLFNAINIATEKHGVENIILIDHEDCGAYGGSEKFDGDAEAEKQFHIEKLAEAKNILQKEYPDIKVMTFYMSWNIMEEVN